MDYSTPEKKAKDAAFLARLHAISDLTKNQRNRLQQFEKAHNTRLSAPEILERFRQKEARRK